MLVCSRLPADGMAIYPFLLVKNKKLKSDQILIQHEIIHFKQQLELLLFGFYILYVSFYLINLLKYRNRAQAYRAIPFEKEAYANENQVGYLKERKLFSWWKYV